jgi:hypothetical protein
MFWKKRAAGKGAMRDSARKKHRDSNMKGK